MLRVKKNDRVRIHCQGIVAEGKVDTVYDTRVYHGTLDNPVRYLIGYEPDGIEMHDEKNKRPHYWKRDDDGHVYLLELSGEWTQVYPRTCGGWTRYDE